LAGEPAPSISEITKFVAEAVAHAPSVYHTLPWWFSTTDTTTCLHADTERRLPVIDPAGREMLISCGAAVFTARVASRYFGVGPEVRLLPHADIPNLIAEFSCPSEPKPTSDYERRLFDEITARADYQGEFDSDRVPSGVISTLAEEAARENATLLVLGDEGHRAAMLAVTATAQVAFGLDSARTGEIAAWEPVRAHLPQNPGWGAPVAAPSTAAGSPGVVTVLATSGDDRVDWVRAGQALQRILLVASSKGVSAALSAEAIEFASLREFIRAELVGGDYPQMVLRFGLAASPDRSA